MRYCIARTGRDISRVEVGCSLVRYSWRKLSLVRRVVRGKTSAKLVPDGEQIVVVSQIGQELPDGLIRRDSRENGVLNRRESVARLHDMGHPTAARELLVEKPGSAIVGHSQRNVGGIDDGGMRQVGLGPGQTAVGRAAHMERVNVPFTAAIRPTHVHCGTVVRIDSDG